MCLRTLDIFNHLWINLEFFFRTTTEHIKAALTARYSKPVDVSSLCIVVQVSGVSFFKPLEAL
jgi:hypothetical protein